MTLVKDLNALQPTTTIQTLSSPLMNAGKDLSTVQPKEWECSNHERILNSIIVVEQETRDMSFDEQETLITSSAGTRNNQEGRGHVDGKVERSHDDNTQ